MENGNYRWVKENPPKNNKPDFGKVKKTLLILAIVALAAVLVFTSYYTVDDKQQAVVTTFGKVTDITDPGLHFKIPFGVQQVHKVDVNVYQKIELGYVTNENGITSTKTGESTMITGDYNIVNVDFFVEYKISDPVTYLFSSTDPEMILRNLIQSQVKELVAEILAEYDIGLTLVDVRIQDAEPPTNEVVEAFKAVETAKQQAEAVVNEAKAYQNAQIPNAEAQADKLLQNAQFLKQKRINEAVEAVAMFEAMYAEYIQNPDITKARMYFEAISQILPGVKLYINTGSGESIDMLLPLESLVGGK